MTSINATSPAARRAAQPPPPAPCAAGRPLGRHARRADCCSPCVLPFVLTNYRVFQATMVLIYAIALLG
jgi:hypothetical protein